MKKIEYVHEGDFREGTCKQPECVAVVRVSEIKRWLEAFPTHGAYDRIMIERILASLKEGT